MRRFAIYDDLDEGFWSFSHLKFMIKEFKYDICKSVKRCIFRIKNGFHEKESWDLYSYTCAWILPRLKHYRNNLSGHPATLTEQEWNDILDKIIWSMEHHEEFVKPIYPQNYDEMSFFNMIKTADGKYTMSDEMQKSIDWTPVKEHETRIDEGFVLLGKYFRNLWD